MYRSFRKTELRLENIYLEGIDPVLVSRRIAEALRVDPRCVVVSNAERYMLSVDILGAGINIEKTPSLRRALLKRLRDTPGIHLSGKTRISSEGVLGFISLDRREAGEAIRSAKRIMRQIRRRIARRVMVYPTGGEVRDGVVSDLNGPLISERLQRRGYEVRIGRVLDDDSYVIASAIKSAADEGYGLIITTGGVGGEAKDRTVEAVMRLDKSAAVLSVGGFMHEGSAREVRIAVGEVGGSIVIALPGPTEEVEVGLEALLNGLSTRIDKHGLAGRISKALKKRIMKHSPPANPPRTKGRGAR